MFQFYVSVLPVFDCIRPIVPYFASGSLPLHSAFYQSSSKAGRGRKIWKKKLGFSWNFDMRADILGPLLLRLCWILTRFLLLSDLFIHVKNLELCKPLWDLLTIRNERRKQLIRNFLLVAKHLHMENILVFATVIPKAPQGLTIATAMITFSESCNLSYDLNLV